MPQARSKPIRLWWIIAMVIFTVVYRVVSAKSDFLGNTTPLMALCFGGGLLLGLRFWWVPALLLIISDIALGLMFGAGLGAYTFLTIVCYTLAALAGGFVGEKSTDWSNLLFGTLTCSLLFYLAANTLSWASSAEYTKTLAGWVQSQTTGLPQYSPPAWAFLRNALIADTIWCLVAAPLFFWSKLVLPATSAARA